MNKPLRKTWRLICFSISGILNLGPLTLESRPFLSAPKWVLHTLLNSCKTNPSQFAKHLKALHYTRHYRALLRKLQSIFCVLPTNSFASCEQNPSQAANKSWEEFCLYYVKKFASNRSKMSCNCEENSLYYYAFKFFVLQPSCSQGFISAWF